MKKAIKEDQILAGCYDENTAKKVVAFLRE